MERIFFAFGMCWFDGKTTNGIASGVVVGRGNLVPRPRSAGLYERHDERMTEDRTEKTGPSGAAGKLGDIAADAGPREAGG